MIAIKVNTELNELNDYELSSNSLGEVMDDKFDLELLDKITEKSWLVLKDNKPIILVGVVCQSLIGTYPELWAVSFATLEKSSIQARTLKKLMPVITTDYKRLKMRVISKYKSGCKFAEFLGFEKVSESKTHFNYEMRA